MVAETLKLAIINLHSELRGMDRERFNTYKRALSLKSPKNNEKFIEVAHKGLMTFWIIAQKIDSETFVSAILDKELPPVKLSGQEMELLKGGSGWESFAEGFITTMTSSSQTEGPGSTTFFNYVATQRVA